MSSPQFSLDYQFKNPELLAQALRHKSFAHENISQGLKHNEKLEFLGDAVINLILSECLMEKFAADEEGQLSKKRASLVNENALAEIAARLNLVTDLKLGKGELLSEGKKKPRLLASAYEAVIGAVFVDGGFEVAKKMVREHFETLLELMSPTTGYFQDFKTQFQELAQAKSKSTPTYEVIKEEGPSHSPQFFVQVCVLGKVISQGQGRSKKIAEQEAAKNALEIWRSNV